MSKHRGRNARRETRETGLNATHRSSVPGDERRAQIRAELVAIAATRYRLNKQVQALRCRQYQAIQDGRDERMTWGEIADALKLAGPTVHGLRPPPGWKARRDESGR